MAISGGNPGISRLAKTISDRSKSLANDANETVMDFGEIQSDWSLLTNTFPKKIPKGSYSVLRHVGGHSFMTKNSDYHVHEVRLPALKKGDHVLVAWVLNTPVVLDVLVSSSEL